MPSGSRARSSARLCDLPDHHDRSSDHGPGLCLRKIPMAPQTAHSPHIACKVHGAHGFFFRRKVLRRDLPLLASFKLTYRCNCDAHHAPTIGETMPLMTRSTGSPPQRPRCAPSRRLPDRRLRGGEPCCGATAPGHSGPGPLCRERFLCTAATTNGPCPRCACRCAVGEP